MRGFERFKKSKITFVIVIILIGGIVGARMYLPYWLRDYVNREIDALEGYSGSVADIDVHLWRGAYKIHDLQIFKDNSDIPVPFVAVKTSDLSVEWKALLEGAIVAEIDLYDADLNFAKGRAGDMQTGEGAEWTVFIDELSPLDINRLSVHSGELYYKDFSASPQVDIFIKNIRMQVENLKNVEDKNQALPSPVQVSGTSIGNGDLKADGALNIIKDVPDFDLNIKLENAALPSINNYSRSIAAVDFESGSLSIFIEAAAKDGQVTGYIKPVAIDVEMVDIEQDKNPLNLAWQSIVSVFSEVFENQPEDQLATRIELQGNINNPDTDTWSGIVGIFRNTFNAFTKDTDDNIDFSNVSD